MSFAAHHLQLKQAVASFRGQQLKTTDIKEIFSEAFPELDVAWVSPSDHCDNHTCKGACDCAKTDGALFTKIKRGVYLVR